MNFSGGRFFRIGATVVFLGGSVCVQTALAQSAAIGSLEEVIVTAQRVDSELSKTPVTVSVLTSDAMARAQISSESDLRIAVPGLSIRAGTNSNQLNYSIRGNSQDAFSGTRPGVLPYLNDVQIGGSGGSSAFYDLQSIQVLKGPQGTLFGRSATGGAVLYTTTRPGGEVGGYLSAMAGDYDARKYEGAVDLPLIQDVLLSRVAGFYSERDGFQKNIFDDSTEGDMRRHGGRLSLTFTYSALENDLVVDYYKADGENMVGVISGLMPLGAVGTPPYMPLQYLYAGVDTPQDRATGIGTLQAFSGVDAGTAAAFYDAYFSDARRPNGGLLEALAAQRARGPYRISSDAQNLYVAENIIVTNSTSYDIGDNLTIKNILGYTDLDNRVSFEADGTPFGISHSGIKGVPGRSGYYNDSKQVSNELQLIGIAADDRLDYVLGVYYSDEDFQSINYNGYFDIFFGGQQQPRHYRLENKTYAGYAQGKYQLNDSGLALTLGARHTSEEVRKLKLPGDIDLILDPVAQDGFDYDQSMTFDRLSWNVGIEDQVTPDLFIYAASRRAYKSGGFVGTAPARVGFGETAGDAFRAERVTDAEIGVKYHGEVGGVPFRINTAIYHQWIENSQRTAYSMVDSGPTALTVNVPEGKASGAEIDGMIQLTGWLSVGGNINYIDSSFGSKPANANGQSQVFDQVPDTPEWTGIFYVDVTVPFAGSLMATFHADVYGQSRAYVSPRSQNSAGTTIQDYTLTNFRITLEDQASNWSVNANLKNAFDKTYYVGGLPAGEIYQVNTLVPGEPRTFTLEARYKF